MTVSLRTRLLTGIILGTTFLLIIFSMAVYTITHRVLLRQFDASLYARASIFSALTEEETDPNHFTVDDIGKIPQRLEAAQRKLDFEDLLSSEFNNFNRSVYYQIWSPAGQTLLRSPSVGSGDLDYFGYSGTGPQYRNLVLPDDTPGRAVSYRYLPKFENQPYDPRPEAAKLTLVLAQSTAPITDHLHFLKWLLTLSSIAVIGLSTGVAAQVTRTGLRPLRVLARKINAVSPDNLGLTLPPDQYPAELAPICTRLNEAFSRLEKSFARQRQFNADVAHELRTPLAGMRSTIEVCLSRPRESSEYQEALSDSLQIAKVMHKMIESLLLVSKLDAGVTEIQKQPIALRQWIDDAIRGFTDRIRGKNIAFENAIPSQTICRSDKDLLGMIFHNLLENAAEYANPGGRIRAAADPVSGGVQITLSNTGCSLTKADIEHVFDFFWRKTPVRTEAGLHCGIGLSVAHKIADALAITIDVSVSQDIFTVRLIIPD